jgi:hypothetical protein
LSKNPPLSFGARYNYNNAKGGDTMTAGKRALQRKQACLVAGGNAPVPHDLFRRLIPLARQYDKGYGDIAQLYLYLLANVNGQPANARYMSAWPSVLTIAAETGIGRNRVPKLVSVLEAVGLVEVEYEQQATKRLKFYYPQYYSALTDVEIHGRLKAMHSTVQTDALHSAQ